LKILIADDNNTERLILSRVLENIGHEVVQAEDGTTAITQFEKHVPALVFLDVLMPGYDGYEVAEIIIKESSRPWFPIIFLTSLTEASDLAKCIDAGGDDFVSKPINRIIIKAKVDAFERIINLYDTVAEQREKIHFHHQHLVQEQEAAKKVFNNIAHRGCLESKNINYHLSPMSIFNGDLMLAAELPMGGMRLMLADFTGHGLPAAIGALPASEIFYGMTTKGFSISDMMVEMNTRLYNILPRGVFCCAIVFDIDSLDNRLTIWNAGAPDSYLVDQTQNSVQLIHSAHLPLGIQSPQKFEVKCSGFEFTEHHKIIAVTDGIIEATNQDLEMYGENRMLECINQTKADSSICDRLLAEVGEFCGELEQADDVSVLEVAFPRHSNMAVTSTANSTTTASGTSDSVVSLKLRGKSLENFDPIPMFLQTLLSCKELLPHRARIFTVLSELYNNALDHGVLGLDSAIKNDSDGFARYYQQRAKGLKELDVGFVSVSVDHRPTATGGELIFELTDSGAGFEVDKIVKQGSKNYTGRGLPLLINLCDSIEYLEGGTSVQAIYRWDHDDIPD